MKTYQLRLPITTIEGVEYKEIKDGVEKPVYLSSPLMTILTQQSTKNFVKHLGWATSLHDKGTLTLDEADVSYLQDFVKNNETLIDLIKYQIYKALTNPIEEPA